MTLLPDVEAALRRHAAVLENALAQLSTLDGLYADHRRQAESLQEAAVTALAAAALPSLDDAAALASSARALHLSALEPDAVAAVVAERRRALEDRARDLNADVRLQGAKARLALLEERARELAEPVSHLRESVRALEQDKDFQTFLAHRDDPRWWTFSFHRGRSAGERALARHGAKRRISDVGALAKKHSEEREALATLQGELSSAAAEHTSLRELLAEHARVTAALNDVETSLLDELRGAVRSTVEGLDDKELLSRFGGASVRSHALRLSGSRARVRYLDAVFTHYVERTRRELSSRLQDIALVLREGPGAARRGPGDTAAEIDAHSSRRARELEEKQRLYRSAADRLLAFRRWDEHDPLAGDLWWDAIMGGLVDGSFIDEVAWHRTMGRPRGPRLPTGDADHRQTWARNADNATAALAAAHAEMLEEQRADEGDDDDDDDARQSAVPAPVLLPDE